MCVCVCVCTRPSKCVREAEREREREQVCLEWRTGDRKDFKINPREHQMPSDSRSIAPHLALSVSPGGV